MTNTNTKDGVVTILQIDQLESSLTQLMGRLHVAELVIGGVGVVVVLVEEEVGLLFEMVAGGEIVELLSRQ